MMGTAHPTNKQLSNNGHNSASDEAKPATESKK